jgi:hypothetical protein
MSKPEASERKAGSMAGLLLTLSILVGTLFAIAGSAIPAVFFFPLWIVGEAVIPAWDAIDPTVPRLPPLPKDISDLKDADARGQALRAKIDQCYAALPETRKPWVYKYFAPPYVGYSVDISKIVRHYIPAGASFDEAERILEAAGLTIDWPRPPNGVMETGRIPRHDYKVRASLEQSTDPPGYVRVYVYMLPQTRGDYGANSAVGPIAASIVKHLGAPIPGVSFPLDVSRAATELDVLVKITETRSYEFDLTFRARSFSDFPLLRKVSGEGFRFRDEPALKNPGVAIPIRVTVANEGQPPFYDRTIDTEGSYASGTLKISRSAGGTELGPGLYRFKVTTLRDIPELTDVRVDFTITWDARI